jgi:NAD-specific glutamate dehydrogenase
VLISNADDVIRAAEIAQASTTAVALQQIYGAIGYALAHGTKWLLQMQPASTTIAALVERFGQPVQNMLLQLEPRPQTTFAQWPETGVDPLLAERVGRLASLADMLEIADIGSGAEMPLDRVAAAYVAVDTLVDLAWTRDSLRALSDSDDRWQRRAAEGLSEELLHARRRLTRTIIGRSGADASEPRSLDEYRAAHGTQLAALQQLIKDARAMPKPSLAALLVVGRELDRLCDSDT